MQAHDVSDRGRKVVSTIAWLAACLCIGGIVALVAFELQQQDVVPAAFYPVIFPVLVGLAVGAGCLMVARLFALRCAWLTLIVMAAAACSVVAQDYLAFTRYRIAYAEMEGRNPRLELLRRAQGDVGPSTFAAFLRARVQRNRMAWSLDAVLTVAAAGAVFAALSLKGPGLAAEVRPEAHDEVTG